MPKNRRRYSRHKCTIRALLRERARSAQVVTEDISHHGVFVVTDNPKSERQLVRLSFDLPDEAPLDVIGMVTRSVTATEAAGAQLKPGMGIDFFALSREAKDRWDAFVQRQTGEGDSRAGLPLPTRRQHPRHVSCFLVRLRDRQRMRDYYTRDISAGGTLLRTPSPAEVTPAVELILVHPETETEFQLAGRVVRVVDSPAVHDRSVAIAFEPLAPEKEIALLAFIETGVNFLDSTPEARARKLDLLERAAEISPDSPLPLTALGQALFEADQQTMATEAFERALALDPDCMAAHRGIYETLTAMGAHSRAHPHLVIIRRHAKRLE